MSSIVLPTLAEWKKSTTQGVFHKRGKHLAALDAAIDKYNQQTSDYGKKWQIEEVRIALDQWKAAKGREGKNATENSWRTHPRNANGAMDKLDTLLPLPAPPPQAEVIEESTENLRKGTLFFLSRITTSHGVPSKILAVLKDGAVAGAAVKELVEAAQPDKVAELLNDIRENGLMNPDCGVEPPAPDSQNGIVAGIIESVKQLVAKLVEQFPGDAAEKAANWITEQTPEVVAEVLGSVCQHLGCAIAIAGNLKRAVSAAVDYFKTRDLESGLVSGQPKIVIESIREQIAMFGFQGLLLALEKALMAGIASANPAIGSIVGAIRSIMAFVIKAFLHFRETWKLNKVIEQAKAHYEAKLWEDANAFYKWYIDVIAELPIISCYCLAMPMTGSYFGFLSMTSPDGLALSQAQMKEFYDLFEDVKGRAKQFVGTHGVKLTSDDPIVSLSLDVAKGKTVDMAKREKEAAAAKQKEATAAAKSND